MQSQNLRVEHVQPLVREEPRPNDELSWAKFKLAKTTVYWLLTLLTVSTIATPAIAALVVSTELTRRTFIVGLLMTGTVACVGRLLSNSLKLISQLTCSVKR